MNSIKYLIKNFLKNTLFQEGKIVTILFGPLKGYRYLISENSGWAPIYGGWEPEATKLYKQLILPGQVVYDLGANTGIHSLLFSKLVSQSGKVFAFEPLPDNILEIERVKDLNQVVNITIIDKAISSHSGSANFKIGKSNKQGSLVGIGCETGSVYTCEVTTLDILIQNGLPSPDFVKIDIEGSEADALEGFAFSLDKSFPTFCIDLHTPEQDVRVGKFLADRSYSLYRLRNGTSIQVANQRCLLEKIEDYTKGWPSLNGIWGTVMAIHPSREKNYDMRKICI